MANQFSLPASLQVPQSPMRKQSSPNPKVNAIQRRLRQVGVDRVKPPVAQPAYEVNVS